MAPVLGECGKGKRVEWREAPLRTALSPAPPQDSLESRSAPPLTPPLVSGVCEQAPQGSGQFVSGGVCSLGKGQGWDGARWAMRKDREGQAVWLVLAPLSWLLPLPPPASAEIPKRARE